MTHAKRFNSELKNVELSNVYRLDSFYARLKDSCITGDQSYEWFLETKEL